MSPGRRRSGPVLLVTGRVPPDRVGALQALHAEQGIELALFGGRSHHATGGVADPGVPHRHVSERAVLRLAASGRYRAVICGTAGRLALPLAYAGARLARVPFILWTALWEHPRSPAFRLAGTPLLHLLYRRADAVAVYGTHVERFVRARGARNVHVAPQAVDGTFWSAPAGEPRRAAPFTVVHVGRDVPGKGIGVLLEAWERSGLQEPEAALVLVGEVAPERSLPAGVRAAGPQDPEGVRNFLAGADVLVMSAIPTRDFREPWGLVANEAMHQHLPVLATDAVGAAAGGLVRHGASGLVVPAGDPGAMASALRRLRDDPALRRQLGDQAAEDVRRATFAAWAAGMSAALESAGAGTPTRKDR